MLNKFVVGTRGGGVTERHVIMNISPVTTGMTKEDALNLVAWLSVIADISDEEIMAARREVEES